jgi:hypothetical protein
MYFSDRVFRFYFRKARVHVRLHDHPRSLPVFDRSVVQVGAASWSCHLVIDLFALTSRSHARALGQVLGQNLAVVKSAPNYQCIFLLMAERGVRHVHRITRAAAATDTWLCPLSARESACGRRNLQKFFEGCGKAIRDFFGVPVRGRGRRGKTRAERLRIGGLRPSAAASCVRPRCAASS